MQTPAQIPETLFFDDEPLLMCTTPLAPWLKQRRIELRTEKTSDRCLRRYLGNWELHRAHLYLVSLRPFGGRGVVLGTEGNGTAEFSLHGLFPDSHGPVCALWFCGQLCCPIGQILSYRDAGYGPVYERDMLVDVAHGRVERIVFRNNDVEPLCVTVAPDAWPADDAPRVLPAMPSPRAAEGVPLR